MRTICYTVALLGFVLPLAWAEEPVFSGPQPGEAISPFSVQAVFGKEAGNEVELLKDTKSPTLLVFVHKVTRPSVGLTRLLVNYAATKQKAGLETQLVFLTKDPTDTEAWMQRAKRALPNKVQPYLYAKGEEGPGAYGLNRNVTLTILLANKGRVTDNFALIQPSVQADAVKVGAAIAKTLGEKSPTLKDMGLDARGMAMVRRAQGGGRNQANPKQDAIYREKIAAVINRDATPKEVEAAAKKVEEFAALNLWFQARVHKAANLIIDGGKLENYGTQEAQAYLKKWSKEMEPPKRAKREEADRQKNATDNDSKTAPTVAPADKPKKDVAAENAATDNKAAE